jgi:hypothetical protein
MIMMRRAVMKHSIRVYRWEYVITITVQKHQVVSSRNLIGTLISPGTISPRKNNQTERRS